MVEYDVVTIGGGLAGSLLARSLSDRGVRVLVVERDQEFKDRVRGEQMQPWGVADLRALSIYEMMRRNGHEQPWIDMFLGPDQISHRDLTETTPAAAAHFNFYHPRMQQALMNAAVQSGADVWRGATVTGVRTGGKPTVTVERDGKVDEVAARLVVGADGRGSEARGWGGFEVKRDPPFLMIAGLLVDAMPIPADTGLIFLNPGVSQGAYLFPQGEGRVRAYSAYPANAGYRLQGDKDIPRFIDESVKAGASPVIYAGMRPAGPLASFEASDAWIEHPYKDGFVLVGDAAAANDPSWGQGLALTVRDVRVLRDRLLDTDDWNAACHDYAREHDRHYGVIHDVTNAFKDMFLRSGPEFDALRSRALPLIGQDPQRVPDHLFSGPDLPWNDEVRRIFFGEGTQVHQQ